MTHPVNAALLKAAEIFDSRNATYQDGFNKTGKIMSAFFPNGVTLNTEDDFVRFATLQMCVGKLNRYTTAFSSGGHQDSVDDLICYAAILSHLTERQK